MLATALIKYCWWLVEWVLVRRVIVLQVESELWAVARWKLSACSSTVSPRCKVCNSSSKYSSVQVVDLRLCSSQSLTWQLVRNSCSSSSQPYMIKTTTLPVTSTNLKPYIKRCLFKNISEWVTLTCLFNSLKLWKD